MERLVDEGVYTAAFPLHDVRYIGITKYGLLLTTFSPLRVKFKDQFRAIDLTEMSIFGAPPKYRPLPSSKDRRHWILKLSFAVSSLEVNRRSFLPPRHCLIPPSRSLIH